MDGFRALTGAGSPNAGRRANQVPGPSHRGAAVGSLAGVDISQRCRPEVFLRVETQMNPPPPPAR
ncbi:hypothetical protein LX32DRAFT_311495 [Colletotrichum zoysiae]|uniref:Uncharacterized protein n=1 Tax=Colletotrichum zoysiae TaxID=1216348 RepID=A0AAD9H1F5_9PEZI|nr:hypothetical protein LX32DRAFT_311495 [Colletotrichum zoysiae]